MLHRGLATGLIVVFAAVSAFAKVGDVDPYLVVSMVPDDDPYYEACLELVRLRGGRVIEAAPANLPALLEKLRQISPTHVAVVLRPATLDENFVRRFMDLATRLDDDPFVDFAYGFITGDSAESAVALAGAGKRAEVLHRQPESALLGVGGTAQSKSVSASQDIPLRKGTLKQTVHLIAADESANAATAQIDPQQDDAFIQDVMPKLAGNSIVLFAGHGYPTHVVSGPTYRHLAGQRYDGAVVLNIACYTGATGAWFDTDWKSMKMRKKEVAADESFCLNLLKTGVAGYIAYVSPRPAGPTMFGDAITLATAGESIGALMRQNANSVVLAHLQLGHGTLYVEEIADGTPIKRDRKTQDILTAMSTGGVLFGDPAYVPFKPRPGAHPVQMTVNRQADAIDARVDIAGPLYHFFCSDQVVMWDVKSPSIRIEAVVPLEGRFVKDVRLVDTTLGDAPYRLTAATEEHSGARYVHVKATFAQPAPPRMMALVDKGLAANLQILTSNQRQKEPILRRMENR